MNTFFFYGIILGIIYPFRRISRQLFNSNCNFFLYTYLTGKKGLTQVKYLFAPFFYKKKQQNNNEKQVVVRVVGHFLSFGTAGGCRCVLFLGVNRSTFFLPLYIPSCFFSFVFIFFFLIFFQLWAAPASPCVWFGPHTSNPFPLYYVYYFSILVRLCLCSLAVCALSVCCCCFIIFDFFFPPFFLVFLVVRFFNQKILGISCLRGMKTNEKRMKVRWSRGHKNTMIHGNKTVLAHVQRHHLAVSS